MSKPTILTVDDDPLVSAAITRDLRSGTASDYRVVRARRVARRSRCSPARAPRRAGGPDRGRPADAADDRHRDARAGPRSTRPGAKFLLLTAYADTDVAIRAINDIGLDYYLLKPWDPPEERLYPVLDDLLGDWRQAHPDHTADVRVVGHRWSDRSHEIKTFLARNHVPYRWYDVERDEEAHGCATSPVATPADLPLVLVPDGDTLRSPTDAGAGRRARAAHQRAAAAVRRVHRRRRTGRAGRRASTPRRRA